MFDYEEQTSIDLPVILYDSGEPIMSATVNVQICVDDENDNCMSDGSKGRGRSICRADRVEGRNFAYDGEIEAYVNRGGSLLFGAIGIILNNFAYHKCEVALYCTVL